MHSFLFSIPKKPLAARTKAALSIKETNSIAVKLSSNSGGDNIDWMRLRKCFRFVSSVTHMTLTHNLGRRNNQKKRHTQAKATFRDQRNNSKTPLGETRPRKGGPDCVAAETFMYERQRREHIVLRGDGDEQSEEL